MNFKKLIIIGVLLIVYDRIEYLYYAFDTPEQLIPFALQGDPIRKDSYVYFVSIRIQQIIGVFIVHLLLNVPQATKWIVAAFIAVLMEFPLTYNQPIAKIPLPYDFYVPVSCETLRLCSICYFLYYVLLQWARKF